MLFSQQPGAVGLGLRASRADGAQFQGLRRHQVGLPGSRGPGWAQRMGPLFRIWNWRLEGLDEFHMVPICNYGCRSVEMMISPHHLEVLKLVCLGGIVTLLPPFLGDRIIEKWRLDHGKVNPGKHTKSYWKWLFIVDFPMKNGDFQ